MAIDVTLKNYEAIPDLSLTISGFTGLTGLSNAGKSVFIRGIASAIYNSSTERCINWNASEAKVSLNFRAPHPPLKIEWTRFRQTTEVRINDDQVFRKLGGQTPKPIVDYGFRWIADKSPNFHMLEDTFFLLHEKESVVADVFQEVLHFAKISDALELCNSERKKAVSRLNVRREDLTTAEQQAKEIPVLEDLENRIDTLLQTIQKKQGLQDTLTVLDAWKVRHQALIETDDRLLHLRKKLRATQKAFEKMELCRKEEEALEVTRKVDQFSSLQHKLKWVTGIPTLLVFSEELLHLNRLGTSISTVSTALEKSRKIQESFAPTQTAMTTFTRCLESLTKLGEWQAAHQQTIRHATATEKERKDIQDELQDIQVRLAQVKICPLCNNPFHHEEHL